MDSADQLIPSLLLGGYRSFGPQQRFRRFSKVNLLIGPNNSGKSNVLRFLHGVSPQLGPVNPGGSRFAFGQLDRHFPNHAEFRYGLSISLETNSNGSTDQVEKFVAPKIGNHQLVAEAVASTIAILKRKAELDKTEEDVWFEFGQDGKVVRGNWDEAFRVLNDGRIQRLWTILTGATGGSRDHHWIPSALEKLTPQWRHVPVAFIPAIRSVGKKGTQFNGFGGEGLIERLAQLQNPDVHHQPDKEKFEGIARFLQSVTDNDSARIEIPYERDTIVVHMSGKALPLESLGTGIHEVLILAAAATILDGHVVCMEEPEIHLNPILQRKLVRYLSKSTNNQYFIATHSAALMDTGDAEIYHIQLQNGESRVSRVTSDRERSVVCEDLGYHPSDLLQANCLIWVEGPSDRIYIKKWIAKCAPELQEGVHYSIMFYGGRLASHLSGNDIDEVIKEFISLRRLNRRAVILIDSDRKSKEKPLNATKERLVSEFNAGPGHAWVTDGREIENYIPADQIRDAIQKVAPTATSTSRLGRYDKMLAIKTASKKLDQAPKVEVAKYVTTHYELDDSRLDLKDQLVKLVKFIRESNPSNERVSA